MRQFWVGLIVIIMALALGVGGAFGASVLLRNKIANLPSIRLNNNLPLGQPGGNQRRYSPWMNPGGRQGFGPGNGRDWGGNGPLMGPGGRGSRHFNNCPVPNADQNQGNGQSPNQGQPQNNCPPLGRFNQPVNPKNGNGNGPY
jgi:hypothetical protein